MRPSTIVAVWAGETDKLGYVLFQLAPWANDFYWGPTAAVRADFRDFVAKPLPDANFVAVRRS